MIASAFLMASLSPAFFSTQFANRQKMLCLNEKTEGSAIGYARSSRPTAASDEHLVEGSFITQNPLNGLATHAAIAIL